MTIKQEEFAEKLISHLRKYEGWARFHEIKEHIPTSLMPEIKHATMDLMKEYGIIEKFDIKSIRLTKFGWEFPGFPEYRRLEKEKANRKDLIENLTVDQLRKEIFKLKYWLFFAAVNATISAIVAYVVTQVSF